MGGIILEKALLMSRARQDEFPSVYPYVAGSIFLGTPFHALTEPRAQVLAKMAESLIGIGTSSEIVEFLAKDVQSLRNLHDDFAVLAGEAQLRLYCFFEQKDIERVRFSIKGIPKASYKSQDFIVDAYSARHSSANTLGLAADHFRLNKYETPKDPNFTFVSEEIRSIVRKADGILRSRQNAQIKALVDERTYRRMVNHLVKGFQDFDSAINGQHKGSQGSELLEQAAFTEWRQQDTNKLLWVHGKAGTGQGAVASAAIESLKPTGEDGSVVVSFYCDQSEKLRRSLLGLLQLVVYQVIENNRDLAVHLLSDSKKAKEVGKQEFNPEATLREQVLWDALQSMAKYLPNRTIYIIVYGLEQLSEDALDDFLLYMKLISDASPLMDEVYDVAPIKWLLLSRSNRPSIRACLRPRALEIDLEVKENAALISNNLRFQISRSVDDLQLPSSLAYFVKRHVHSRSEDNEIYIKLVIQEVRNAWIPGKTPHADIRKLLESFPYGLTNLFDHICKRVLNPKAEGFEYTKEILRCRICAHVSPTMRDLAIMAGLPEDDRENLEKLKTYVLRCGAFLTLRGDKWDLRNNTVEWINISAQEYLQQYARAMLGLDLLDMQNGIIALRCLEYIYEVFDRPIFGDEQLRGPENVSTQDGDKHMDYSKEDGANFARSDSKDTRVYEKSNNAHADDDSSTDGGSDVKREEGGIDSNRDRDTGTVLTRNTEYPMRYWVKHAQRAPRDMLDELDLNLPFWQDESEARQRWWQLIPDVQSSDQQDGVSALHMAVVLKFPALVEYLLERGRGNDTHKDDSLGFQPLYYACRGGDEDIVNALLGAEADINYTSDSNQPAALHAAASNWHRKIVETLLERDADLDATSPDHGTALYAAISNHDHEITKLLLSRGAKVNTIGGAARRALNVGALVGNLEGVRALVDLGADVDPDEDYWYGSAVGAASRNGHADVVEYLLSRGWDSSRAMKTYGSFLVAAATYKHLGVVEILLKKEERVFVLESALLVASKRGYVAILEAILGKRPALNLQRAFSQAAYYGRTEVLEALFKNDLEGELRRDKQILDAALYQATDNEHEETVKLLLEHGADPNTTGPT
jgi:ankyrin repeat protein